MIAVSNSSALLAALVLLAAAAGGAVSVLRPAWLVGTPPPAVAETRPPSDPFEGFPEGLAALLVRPGPDAPSPFVRIARVKPEAFCKGLGRWGLKNAAFQKSEPPLHGWTCVTDLVKPVGGEDAAVSSLFVTARGQDDDRIDTIRMKLNLIDAASAPKVKVVARDALAEISRSLGWETPAETVAALDRLEEGRVLEGGVSYDLRKEFGEAPRFNFIIVFPRLLGAGGEGRFVTDARRGPVTR